MTETGEVSVASSRPKLTRRHKTGALAPVLPSRFHFLKRVAKPKTVNTLRGQGSTLIQKTAFYVRLSCRYRSLSVFLILYSFGTRLQGVAQRHHCHEESAATVRGALPALAH